ncbi:hypothetical protein [Teredinibacter purpureus]|uniref:hypothetical protein n=1 Tax=Teredinibacter purpureus TaxID=2731756 RepID=UPI0005F88108|nr:hypothetical protein [Teredinibacter purpureus]
MSKSKTKQYCPAVEKGIDIPTQKIPRGLEDTQRINWPFLSMDVGDSFLLPYWCEPDRAHKAMAALKRRGKIDDSVAVVSRVEGDTFRVWLTSKAESQ